MNLQIVSPYQKCIFDCKYCVANHENTSYKFSDEFWNKRPKKYLRNLVKAIRDNNIDTVVLTGMTEPTFFKEWIDAVVNTIKVEFGNKVKIEIQTYVKTYKNSKVDVVAYSWNEVETKVAGVFKSNASITRDVFILTKDMSIDKIIEFHKKSKHQTTVKLMADNSYGNKEVNKWIADNRYVPTEDEIIKLQNAGIKYDATCNIGTDRYLIFRTDGKVYSQWWANEEKK